jgi:hypothetical protein
MWDILQPHQQIFLKHLTHLSHTKWYILLFFVTISLIVPDAQENRISAYPVPLMNAYLPNPGMGWQHAPGIGEQRFPETVSYPQRNKLSWQILNPEKDVYNWDVLDTLLEQALAENKQLSFRVYTMSGEDFGGHQIPQWVLDAGAEITPIGEPDYSNCIYQAEWGYFVEALQQRYDGNPVIAYMDISG